MAADEENELDLLLSLRDRVPETPPGSPSSHRPAHTSEDGSPRRRSGTAVDMSVFRDAVKDYLGGEHDAPADAAAAKSGKSKWSEDIVVEKFSGLRIRKVLVSGVELSNHFSDVRFIRLSAIKNSLVGDTISGCWATVGVLTEKGSPKLSTAGKSYCIWKMGCLDESVVSIFLFGDAYTKHSKESAGTVFALFNSGVRKDATGHGFSLSVFSAAQILKMGVSVDYGVCKGKRKDGMTCTMVINKCRGIYCKYHSLNASQKYSTMRSELMGGNVRRAFRLQSEGIHMVDPLKDRTNLSKSVQPVKVLSVDGLKKVLSNAGKVTTKSQSQGIRFLTEVAAKTVPRNMGGGSFKPNQLNGRSEKRLFSDIKLSSNTVSNQQAMGKRKRIDASAKIIELEIFSSDEEG